MSEVVVTGFGVRTAFGQGADALRRGVFGGVPAFAPTTRFDTGPYRTPFAATTGTDKPDLMRDVLGECTDEAVEMAGFTAHDDTAVLVGTSGDEAGVEAADTVPAWQADLLAARIGASSGRRLAFTNACVASAAAIIHACGLIASGRVESAVCAGAYLVEEEVFAKFDAGRAM